MCYTICKSIVLGGILVAREKKIGYITGILSTVIMGFSFYFSKTALNELNNKVFDLLSYRFLMSMIGIGFLWKFKFIKLEYKGKNIKLLLLMCFIQPVAYFIAEAIGLSMITSSEAGLIMALLPVFTIIMGVIFLGEKVSLRQFGFIVIAIGGAIFINIMGYVPQDSSNLGRLILLMAVVIGGVYGVLMRKLSGEFSPMERTSAMMLMGAVIFFLIAASENIYNGTFDTYIRGMFNIKLLIPIIFLGLGSSLIAMYFMNVAYTYLEVKKMAVISNGISIVSIIAGVILLNEAFYWYHILGTIFVLIGGIGISLDDKVEKSEEELLINQKTI